MFLQVNIPLECQFFLSRVKMKRPMVKETYVNHIWKKRAGGFFNIGKPILLDSAKSHSGRAVEQAFSGVKCSVKIIHGILTPLLLFLETNVNTRTHNTHANRWEDWVKNGEDEFTK